ncbi:MAG TPA: nucleoside deaminase [Pirellulales bacterium]|jgi:tRNA(Arg) A34 adenosine deaminase TadA
MKLAIEKTREGFKSGNSPFGCAIAQGNSVIATAHNTVLTTIDSTAHAEVNAIRAGCKHTGQIHLQGAIVATTCEPCPMCMAALHWAQVDTVYFGASVQDAADAGFNELYIDAEKILSMGGSKVKLIGGILPAECKQLFHDWKKLPTAKTY